MRARILTCIGLVCTVLVAVPSASSDATSRTAPARSAAHKSAYTVGKVVYHSKTRFLDAGEASGVTVPCGPGQRLVSPAAMLSSPDDLVAIPAGLSSLGYVDSDADGDPDDQALINVSNVASDIRQLTGWAVCLKGPTSDHISYLQFSDSISGSPPLSIALGQLCSAGRIGGLGGTTTGSPAENSIVGLNLNRDGHRAVPKADSFEFHSSSTNLGFTITTSCVTGPGISAVMALRPMYPGEASTLSVPCPQGTAVIGGGVIGEARPLLGSSPYDSRDPGNAPDDGWAVRVGSNGFNSYAVQAICIEV